MGVIGMAAKFSEAYSSAKGRPMHATVDVTPKWWANRKRSCYGAVAATLAKFRYSVNFTIGLAGVSVEALLVKGEDFGKSIEELGVVLNEMGSEWAEPTEQGATIGCGFPGGPSKVFSD